MQIKQSLLLANFLIVSAGTAIAQAPPAPVTPPAPIAPPAPTRATNDCTPTQTGPQGTITPRDTTTGQSSETLGDKLARSDGVLCPPTGVDPEIRAPTPNTGNTPVIPPPGSPGGDPTIRPK